MKFRKWIFAQGGAPAVGKLIGASRQVVHLWLARETTPKAVTMQRLVRLGQGAFDFNDIINDTKTTQFKQKRQYK